jgi:hypothetical protein
MNTINILMIGKSLASIKYDIEKQLKLWYVSV